MVTGKRIWLRNMVINGMKLSKLRDIHLCNRHHLSGFYLVLLLDYFYDGKLCLLYVLMFLVFCYRKQVDPETAKYFAEISNVIEGSEIDLEERLVICGNALDEARGKEVELATDYIISHTLQTLLEGCSVEHLCGFLRSSAKDFSHIATDRSGSHVAETALKALVMHLEDFDSHSLIEETLSTICKVSSLLVI